MRKSLCCFILLAAMTGSAMGAEFQPIGALGIGGAGVARITNGYAGHWNPAGLAFNEMTMNIPLDVSVGLRVSNGLADNVDRLSKFTEKDSNGNTAFDNLKNLGGSGATPAEQQKAVGDVVSLLSVFQDIETQKGFIALNGDAVFAVQVKHFAFGAFGTMEGFAQAKPDLNNILPSTLDSNTIAQIRSDFANAAAANNPNSTTFFTDPQIRQGVTQNFIDAGFTVPQANNIVNAIDAQMTASAGSTNLPQITQQQAADTIRDTLAPAFGAANGSKGTIDNNQSAVLVKNVIYTEFPLSYGHPIDLGKYGKLGVGGSLKVVGARVYQSQIRLLEKDPVTGETKGVKSDDILDNFKKNYEQSYNVTFDLGAFWKYSDWLNVGLVAKNLTSPTFNSPQLKDQNGNLVTTNPDGTPVRNEKVKLAPQVRMGVSLEPWSWLALAADMDLTSNESVLSGLDYKSRNLGGGLELKPFTWFKLRGGMYTNLANSDVGPVATGGLTFGTKWVNLEIDGAYGLEKAKFKEKSYPKEAKAQVALNIQF